MTCLKALLHTAGWSITLSLAVPLSAEDRCTAGPAGLQDVDYLVACRPRLSAPESRACQPSFGFHEREAVYEVRFIDDPQAWLGLHGRAVLLVSVPALDMLEAGELQALVAHENGHEYLQAEWEVARAAGAHPRLRRLEATCDTIAAVALRALGLSTDTLASATTKIERLRLAGDSIAVGFAARLERSPWAYAGSW